MTYFGPGMGRLKNDLSTSDRYGMINHRDIDFENHPQLAEWYGNREETSHSASPLSVGEKFWDTSSGEKVAAEVLHEERDQHSGEIHTTYRTSTTNGTSGTKRMTWAPGNDARQIIVTSNKRTTD